MINLTEEWIKAGRPAGRRPSDYKATARVKKYLKACPSGWRVEGRGALAATYADETIAVCYASYMTEPVRRASAAAPVDDKVSAHPDRYTAEEMAAAMKAAFEGGKELGRQDGHDKGYAKGYVDGKRDAGSGHAPSYRTGLGDLKARCAQARRTFARTYHPDLRGGQGHAEMAAVNNVFDAIERLLGETA